MAYRRLTLSGIYDIMDRKERKDKMDHMMSLIQEIGVLKLRFQPSDTGHIRGAVRVLQERVQEIRQEIIE